MASTIHYASANQGRLEQLRAGVSRPRAEGRMPAWTAGEVFECAGRLPAGPASRKPRRIAPLLEKNPSRTSRMTSTRLWRRARRSRAATRDLAYSLYEAAIYWATTTA